MGRTDADKIERARQKVLDVEAQLCAEGLSVQRVAELEDQLDTAAQEYELAMEAGDDHAAAYLAWVKANSTEVLP